MAAQQAPAATREQVAVLAQSALFRGVPAEVIERVASAARSVGVAQHEVVVRQGDRAERFYIVEQGALTVSGRFAGREREIGKIGPGDFFGELALMHGGRAGATVRADVPSRLLSLSSDEFHALMEQVPSLSATVRLAAQSRKAARIAKYLEVKRYNIAELLERRGEIRIGRSEDNDLVFTSPSVSRHHAVITLVHGACRLTDLHSNAGTFVNGQEVRGAVDLRDGDEISIVDHRFTFDRRAATEMVERQGIQVDVFRIRKQIASDKTLLHDVSLSILPGELTAIVGGSGAGKTTLMDAMSGVRPATSGTVRYDGHDYYAEMAQYRHTLGYVPQDDIIHHEMPLRLTLKYAAKLRLPRDTTPEEIDAAADRAMEQLDLTGRADVRVGMLSGGQRKRASIGIELLTEPRIFFLDEPTSGLDPTTDRHLMELLRTIADEGKTVVLTTHATANVRLCDKLVVLARDGHLAFFGPPEEALRYFGVTEFDEIYDRLATEHSPPEWGAAFRQTPDFMAIEQGQLPPAYGAVDAGRQAGRPRSRGPAHAFHQFRVLSKRNFDLYARFPTNFIPLIMQPVIITLLLLALFPAGLFVGDSANPTVPLQLVYTFSFVMFLFGLLYGVQEIVKERAIFRRERMVNVGVIPYVLSKTSFLAPLLLLCTIAITFVLWITDRLFDANIFDTYVPLIITLVLTAWAGLALSLLISAAVNNSQMATDLLTPWIAPQVLFAGALLAVPAMTFIGKILATITVVRWSFEGAAEITNLKDLFERSSSPIGEALSIQYADSFNWAATSYWLVLAAFILVPLAISVIVLTKKTQPR
jgi:ABC-type multidrug transport system ATPase subunit/CRP-like cAMP-binding protein